MNVHMLWYIPLKGLNWISSMMIRLWKLTDIRCIFPEDFPFEVHIENVLKYPKIDTNFQQNVNEDISYLLNK